jgi:PTH1 family peptidyl-tRNA hydrolase
MPKVVLGIGNPDEKYAATRHNVGWMVADALSQKLGKKFSKAGFEFWAAEGRLAAKEVVLVKTWTYVNQTGRAIPEIRQRWGDDLLVVCDDVALPLGSVRIRKKGSSGGHNGLESIAQAWGSDEFARLRIGVGGGKPDPDYVLAPFRKDERPVVEETVAYACEAVEHWAWAGLEKTMTKYNRVRKENDENV